MKTIVLKNKKSDQKITVYDDLIRTILNENLLIIAPLYNSVQSRHIVFYDINELVENWEFPVTGEEGHTNIVNYIRYSDPMLYGKIRFYKVTIPNNHEK